MGSIFCHQTLISQLDQFQLCQRYLMAKIMISSMMAAYMKTSVWTMLT
uniref:Uncharacterized protein n=1 Tax=Arundo donax TaxID=35708 RepID=A0A0A9DUV0_ARUDO